MPRVSPHLMQPTITATGTPNGGTFEVGDNKTITNVRVVVGKKSKKITKVEVFDGATSLGLLEDDTIENGGTFDFPVNIEVASVNKQLTASVTDEQGSEVTAKTGAFTFISPYYVGVCDAGATIDEALVTGLTKKVETKATKTISYTTANQKMVLLTIPLFITILLLYLPKKVKLQHKSKPKQKTKDNY